VTDAIEPRNKIDVMGTDLTKDSAHFLDWLLDQKERPDREVFVSTA
jgi:hypothetical protein